MIGRTISHYRIIDKIGEGGMGEVYLAMDLKLERKVAVKFLPQHLTNNKENVERFQREAKATAALNHPNIVTIHEIAEEDKQTFIVMEYVEGKSLRELIIENSQFPIPNSLSIITQICEGLSEAHKVDIVHRDLKPENILFDSRGRVRILDFGLAKLKGVSKLTKETSTLGTIHYMSPEQLWGEAIDFKTDIWSLGVILYELLSGELPFKGNVDQTVIYSISKEEPKPLSEINASISEGLENIVKKCLTKNPAERFQDVDNLRIDLNTFKQDSEVKTTPEIFVTNIIERVKNINNISIIIIIAFMVVVAGYLFFIPKQKSSTIYPEWENSIAVLPFNNISSDPEQEYFCDGITEQIITNLTKLKVLKVIARTSVMPYKNTKKKLAEIGKELSVINILTGSVSKFGDRIRVTAQLVKSEDSSHLWAEKYDFGYELDSIFTIHDDISEKIAEALLQNLSKEQKDGLFTKRPSNLKAYEYFIQANFYFYNNYYLSSSKNDFEASEQLYLKAIELEPNYAPYYTNLTDLYNTKYYVLSDKNEEKKKYLQLQEHYIQKALVIDPNLAEVQYAKGLVHYSNGEIDDAFSSFKKSNQLNPNYSSVNYILGFFFLNRNLINLAIKHLSRAIESDPSLLQYYVHRAFCYFMLQDYTEAENDFVKAMNLDRNNPLLLTIYLFLLIELERYDEAEITCQHIEKYNPDYAYLTLVKSIRFTLKGEKDKILDSYENLEDYEDLFRLWFHIFIYAFAGMNNEFFNCRSWEVFEKFGISYYFNLKNNRVFDPLRSDPRFQDLLSNHKEMYKKNLSKYGDIDI